MGRLRLAAWAGQWWAHGPAYGGMRGALDLALHIPEAAHQLSLFLGRIIVDEVRRPLVGRRAASPCVPGLLRAPC